MVPGDPPRYVDASVLRRLMGEFPTGVAVITTEADGKLYGMSVNSLTSVSLEPPLVLVCLAQASRTAAAVNARRSFALNLLSSSQGAISNHFAQPGADRFDGLSVEFDTGIPILPGALAYITCSVDVIYPAGDHVIVVGIVSRAKVMQSKSPLVFFRGRYHDLVGPRREPPPDWYA